MEDAVIVSAARTPFGKFQGGLAPMKAVQLGGVAIAEALQRANMEPGDIDEVMMGMVLQAGTGQIPARQAARLAGIPWETPSLTINKVCASGLRAVTLARAMIRAGEATAIVAGGMESMSNAPYALPTARTGQRMGDAALVDLMVHDGLTCAFHNVHMAVLGSEVAAEYGITREAQDEFSVLSHRRAVSAIDSGRMADEIVPVTVATRKGDTLVAVDEGPRRDTSLEQLARLSPVFAKDGTVTAGNAPGVNDGSAALVVMAESRSVAEGKVPLAYLRGTAQVGAEAKYIALTPSLAIQKLLAQTGHTVSDIDLFEVNEAFAAVALTTAQRLNLDLERVNVNGGAVALGHPIGASGARILTTLIYELRRRGGGLGIAAICSGAAQGDAVLVEVPA
ncbi:acetyl-CoA C-acetyltransferase [Alicyclobacillus sp. SP_1]|jgi:acetyl-CoA C-acetyltransferase|uniref:acetyl-CoA C-acetyltransferase n=1 Tax=Alicyclobacillus sp. SP_1 TaxID=2942475 RepID=UPI0021574050|nr:acetyl-CoA C-acetyltransferase [Alicyclobacillus sp. SP_1]